jgi:hypothetical protein
VRTLRLLMLVSVLLMAAALHANETSVCKALSAADLEHTQNAKLLLVKPLQRDDGKLTTASCYFRMDPDSESVSLEIISRSKGDSIDPREFWKSHFSEAREQDEQENEAREHHRPPEKIDNLGDEAYWVDTGRDGALYVLNGGKIIRLSLGGKTPQTEKKQRAVQLSTLLLSNSGQH